MPAPWMWDRLTTEVEVWLSGMCSRRKEADIRAPRESLTGIKRSLPAEQGRGWEKATSAEEDKG